MYNKETNLSEHFTKEEVIYSPTAKKYNINNIPNSKQLKNIQSLIDNILEPVRIKLNVPIKVNSIFRSKELNKKIQGSINSQHLANNGAAADIECPDLNNKKLFEIISKEFDFDQLIWEYGDKNNPDWVHVSYISKEKNRNQILKCIKDNKGNPKYINY